VNALFDVLRWEYTCSVSSIESVYQAFLVDGDHDAVADDRAGPQRVLGPGAALPGGPAVGEADGIDALVQTGGVDRATVDDRCSPEPVRGWERPLLGSGGGVDSVEIPTDATDDDDAFAEDRVRQQAGADAERFVPDLFQRFRVEGPQVAVNACNVEYAFGQGGA